MNVFTAIMLIFAAVGLFDKITGGRLVLSKSFDDGLGTIGSMAVPMVGMCCVGTALIENNIDTVQNIAKLLPFDVSMIPGILLGPDMGGYFIAEQLTADENLLLFNGIVLGAVLGQLITFQLPIFLALMRKEDHQPVFKGFMIGIIMIPVGLIVAAILLRLNFKVFIAEFIPIFVICVLLAFGLLKRPLKVVKGFSAFAGGIQIVIHILFFFSVLGLFIPSMAYSDLEALHEVLTIMFRSSIVICGSLVMSELALRYFRKYLEKIAEKLGVNEVAVIGLLLNCATSLSMLPLLSKMDDKGKMLNGAFSVSGAYFLGGQLGFVSSVTDGFGVTVMIVSKLVCGGLSVLIMYKLYDRLKPEN